MKNEFQIQTSEELIAVIGEPVEFVALKVMTFLDEPAQEFINQSPLVFISTVDEKGGIDISPKGDAPGFVKVEGHNVLIIPDRPGNKMALGFHNILKNDEIGLIFVIPNMRETLRVKGRATLSNDPNLLKEFSVNAKPATLCTMITVHECMFHCGKAMIRSKLWQPDSWAANKTSLLAKQLSRIMSISEQDISCALEQDYDEGLY